MRRFLAALAVAFLLAPAAFAVPNGNALLLRARSITPNGECFFTDSRGDYDIGGPVYSSTSYALQAADQGFDFQPALTFGSGNVVPYPATFGRGVSGSTTQGFVGRLNSSSVASTGNPANAITGVAGDNGFNINAPGINFTGAITSNVLTVTNYSAGGNAAALGVGETLVEPNGLTFTITSNGTGTGGNGTYNTSTTLNVSAEAMYVATTGAQAGGPFSIVNDPTCNVVFGLGSINDISNGEPTPLPLTQMQNWATILNALSNKIVILSDETARGVGYTQQGEIHAVPGSPFQVTVTNASGFQSDQVGAMPGVAYTNGSGANTYYTKVASSPASGQYSVTSGGVYTFNSADTGRSLQFFYSFIGASDVTGAKLTQAADLHAWFLSNAANFTGPCSGTNFGVPGALYQRPWVYPALTWEAGGGTNSCATVRNTAGLSLDGTHPIALGARIEGAAIVSVERRIFGTTPLIIPPLYNNAWIASGTGSASTYTGTLPGVMVAQIAAYHAANPSGGPFQICYLLACGVDTTGNGTLVTNGVSGGAFTVTTGSINYTTGAYSITFSGNLTSAFKIVAYLDPTNLMSNGQFDVNQSTAQGHGTISTTTGSSCTTASNSIPGHWAVVLGTSVITNINTGSLILTCGNGTAPDGNNGFFLSFIGQAPASNTVETLTDVIDSPGSFYNVSTAPVDQVRSYAKITMAAGPGGQLAGISVPQLRVANVNGTSGTVFGLRCPTNPCTQVNGYVSLGGTTNGLNSTDLIDDGNTAMEFPLASPLTSTTNDTVPNTITTSEQIDSLELIPNAIVDATVWFENAAIKKEVK